MILTETPRRKLVTQLVNWGHWFALLNILIAISIAGIYVVNSPAPGSWLGVIFMLANWISHIGFLTFFAFVILILPLCYLVPNSKIVKIVSSVVAAIGLALLGFDALLYNKHGIHLSLNSADLIRFEAQTVVAQFGWQQWGFLLFLFFVWLSFQLVVANALWQRVQRLEKRNLGLPITSFFVLCFVLSHGLHVWADARLYQPIVQQDNMFPLSYPATAKTLMARYSLLDIEDYQQRKALQFNHNISGLNYPNKPVYCSVNKQAKVLVLGVTEKNTSLNIAGLTQQTQHYGFHSSIENGVSSILFGLPELYHQALQSESPILLHLPQSRGLSVSTYSQQSSSHLAQAGSSSWSSFSQDIQNGQLNLGIGFVNAKQAQSLLTAEVLAQYKVILTHLEPNETHSSTLLTNFTLRRDYSSTEDIAPTALNILGCDAPVHTYSTGRDLRSNQGLQYLVSTSGSKILLLEGQHRTEIMNNGKVEIFDLTTNQEVSTAIDTTLLSQSIKHLSRFSAKRNYYPQ